MWGGLAPPSWPGVWGLLPSTASDPGCTGLAVGTPGVAAVPKRLKAGYAVPCDYLWCSRVRHEVLARVGIGTS